MRARIRIAVIAAVLALLAGPPGAAADPHAVQIGEVMAGAFGRHDLQFVELRLDGCQEDWGDGARLAFFDAANDPVGSFDLPADAARFCDVALIATPALADLLPFETDPDFMMLMPPSLVPGSGKVCFQNPTASPPVNLCLSYGSFTGDSEQGSPANAPALVPTRTCSLRRKTAFDSLGNPNFNEDFGLDLPAPLSVSLTIPLRFNDVQRTSPFAPAIEALFNAGVTGGCGNGAFCPGQAVTREQMAVLLLRALEGPAFTPPACAVPAFADVPCASPFAPWVNELAARGVTGGCGGGNFCPGAAVTRDQMAVFLLLALEGTGFTPPACTSPAFGDVPCASPFAPWINELAARGITGGCGGGGMGNFCPGAVVTREQMAAFLSMAFALPVPSFDCSDAPNRDDDHGDEPATATPLVPGVTVAAAFETPEDQDYFVFTAEAGDLFTLDAPMETVPEGFPSLVDSISAHLSLADAEGRVFDGNSPFPPGERLVFRIETAGTYFVSARNFFSILGRYHVTLRGPLLDDHGDGAGTATPIPLDSPVAGEMEDEEDVDTFAFPVQAGRIYTVQVHGAGEMTPALLIRDAAGGLVAHGDTAQSIDSREALAVFTAPATGTLFAHVFIRFSIEFGIGGPGPYEIVVRGPFDDEQGGTAGEAGALVPGAPPTEGQLLAGDVDVFAFTAGAGEVFLVEAAGLSEFSGFTLELLGTDGTTVLSSRTALGLRAEGVVLAAAAAGTYFARVSQPGEPTAYRISLRGPVVDDHGGLASPTLLPVDGTAVPGSIDLPDDEDVFRLDVPAEMIHQVVLVELTGVAPGLVTEVRLLDALDAGATLLATGDRAVAIKPEAAATYFVSVRKGFFSRVLTGAYQISARPADDDHADWAGEATLIPSGSPAVAGRIDFLEDADLFAFDAAAGQVFTLKLRATGFPGDTLVSLRVLDTDGVTPLTAGLSSFPRLFTAPAAGRYFLRVERRPGVLRLEPYQLTLGALADDHGDDAAAATLLAVDATATPGAHEHAGDVDVFAFDALAGETLAVETWELGAGSDTVLALLDQDGTTVLASDDDSAGGLASRIEHTFASAGRYFARVTQRSAGDLGTYRVGVRSLP